MKRLSLLTLTVALIAGWMATHHVSAQSWASISLGPIAPAITNCPTPVPSSGFATLCPVGTSAANYTMYVSYNGGAYQLLVPASSATVTGTAPIVVTGGTAVSCPTCATTTNVVTTFNNRSGAVQLTKSDITGTGVAVGTTVTSTATSTLQ